MFIIQTIFLMFLVFRKKSICFYVSFFKSFLGTFHLRFFFSHFSLPFFLKKSDDKYCEFYPWDFKNFSKHSSVYILIRHVLLFTSRFSLGLAEEYRKCISVFWIWLFPQEVFNHQFLFATSSRNIFRITQKKYLPKVNSKETNSHSCFSSLV